MICRFFPHRLFALIACALFPLTGRASSPPPPQRPWSQDVMYFALTDRFFDGDPDNNVPAGSDPTLYDKTQTNMLWYHGGDFRGLELALQRGYFKDLGVTAIWITPPVRNVWCSPFDSDDKPKSGYHGYWAQDFLDIDPHLVSRRSLDGSREYPDTRDGRMQHYKDLVDLAHSQGIKIIQDIVCNHAGPVFYYDANHNGQLDGDQKAEWVPPFSKGPYFEAHWADIPKWNAHSTAPAGPLTILGKLVHLNGSFADLESYGRRGMSPDSLGKQNGEEIECDFFSLRDFWTAPESPHFDRLVDDFVETYAFYAETVGVDGFRIDTIKHVHHAFWDAFTERLRRRLGQPKDLLLFGEVYGGSPAKTGEYTYLEKWPQERGICLDSLLNFPFCDGARAYLRPEKGVFGKSDDLAAAFRSLTATPAGADRPFYNPARGFDGLSASRKLVNFVENHDGLNRFRVQGISERRNLLADALLLLAPGIPCLYYGTEAGLQDAQGTVGKDTETGRMTLAPAGDAARFDALKGGLSYRSIAALAALRRELPALTSGETVPLWADDEEGVFAFARGGGSVEPVVIVVNASDRDRVTGHGDKRLKLVAADGKPLFAEGDKLQRVTVAGLDHPDSAAAGTTEISWKDGVPRVSLYVGPESVNVYRQVR